MTKQVGDIKKVLFVIQSIPSVLIKKARKEGKEIPKSFRVALLDGDFTLKVGDIIWISMLEAKALEHNKLGVILGDCKNEK